MLLAGERSNRGSAADGLVIEVSASMNENPDPSPPSALPLSASTNEKPVPLAPLSVSTNEKPEVAAGVLLG